MNSDPSYEIRKSTYEKRKLLSEDCKKAFVNGESMSRILSGYGVTYSPPACRDLINMKSDPSSIKLYAIEAVIEILDDQKLNEIKARRERVRF